MYQRLGSTKKMKSVGAIRLEMNTALFRGANVYGLSLDFMYFDPLQQWCGSKMKTASVERWEKQMSY